MPHNDYFGRIATLPSRFVPSPAFMRLLDRRASESLNGDGGGSWSPSAPIILGGAGARLSVAGGFTGGLATGAKSRDGALILGDSDYPKFAAARTRTVLFPFVDDLFSDRDINTRVGTSYATYDQGTPGAFTGSTTTLATVNRLELKKFPPGATIASVTARFSVGTKPAVVPTLPIVVLTDDTFLNDDASAMAAPANVDAYFNKGLPQSLTFVPVNNATVVAGKSYAIKLLDESNTSNVWHSIAITFSNIADMRPGL